VLEPILIIKSSPPSITVAVVFIDDLFKMVRQDFDRGCITLTEIIELFQCDNVEYSETCDQCGDTDCSTYYELELDNVKN
jgi:hypothetical protein